MRTETATVAPKRAFTRAELGVVVVIVGVLTAFAVPRFLDSAERARAAEAFNYLATVRAAEARHHALHGRYTDDVAKLDARLQAPAYFKVGAIELASAAAGSDESWELALTRSDASAGYGTYSVVFNQDGFDRADSTIPDLVNPFQTP